LRRRSEKLAPPTRSR